MGRPPIKPQQSPAKTGDPLTDANNLAIHRRLKEVEDRTDLSGSVASSIAAASTGRFLARTVITESCIGSLGPSTTAINLRMVGGGGGGGSATGGTYYAAGAGGSSGNWFEKRISVTGGVQYMATVATVGGSFGLTDLNGADTSLTIGGITYTARGGGAGTLGSNINGLAEAAGGQALGGTTQGDLSGSNNGGRGFVVNAGTFPGDGASCPYGTGGPGSHGTYGTGHDATGYGAGGGGGNAHSVSGNGGKGSPGLIIIDEFG